MSFFSTPQFLLISSALLHAGWNSTTKLAKDKDMFVFATVVLAALIVFGTLMLQERSFIIGGGGGLKFGFLAGLFEGGYLIALARSFTRTSLTRGYSIMRGGAMVFVWAVSLPLALESFHWLSLTGSLIVLFGVLIGGIDKNKPFKVFDREIAWPLAGAVFIAGYHICYGESLKAGAAPNSLYLTSFIVSLPFIAISARARMFSRLRAVVTGEKLLLAFAAVAVSFGFVIFLYGLKHSGPGYAITLRNTSIFFAVAFSFVIRERLSKMQILGALVIGLGALVLGLGGT